jgi:hypothetical protein
MNSAMLLLLWLSLASATNRLNGIVDHKVFTGLVHIVSLMPMYFAGTVLILASISKMYLLYRSVRALCNAAGARHG